jgi:hypothetical protein
VVRLRLAALAVVLLAGCGSEEVEPRPATPTDALTVAEALEREGEEVVVRGYVLRDRDGTRLCSALAESHPPQCGRPSLEVEGLPEDDGELAEAQGVAWSERQLALRGVVTRGVLRVAEPG